MDIIQIAMIDLMDQVQDVIEDLPVGYSGDGKWIKRNL
jgi:hypothetical protein